MCYKLAAGKAHVPWPWEYVKIFPMVKVPVRVKYEVLPDDDSLR